MVIKRSSTVPPPVPSHLEKWGARAPPPCPVVPVPLLQQQVSNLVFCPASIFTCFLVINELFLSVFSAKIICQQIHSFLANVNSIFIVAVLERWLTYDCETCALLFI